MLIIIDITTVFKYNVDIAINIEIKIKVNTHYSITVYIR